MTATYVADRGWTTTSSLALTDPTTIAVGSVLVLVGHSPWSPARAVTDPRGNTWVMREQWNSNSDRISYLAYCVVENAYQSGDALSISGTANARVFQVHEFGGVVVLTDPNDGVASAQNATNSSAFNSGSVTTTTPSSLLLGSIGWTLGPPSWNATGFSQSVVRSSGNERCQLHWRSVDTVVTDAFDGSSSNGTGANAAAILRALKALAERAPRAQAVIIG